jgi:tetratricopeptide (TPR) repeat protein
VAAAIPLHIDRLRSEVARSNQEVLRLSTETRRASLRADCQQHLSEGQAALARKALAIKDLQDAQMRLAQAHDKIEEEDAREDPDLRQLKESARCALAEARRRLDGLTGRAKALEQYNRFFALRDEAFFQLNSNVVLGPNRSGPLAAQAAAHQALDLLGVTAEPGGPPDLALYEPGEQGKLRTGLYEILLLLSEARARPWGATPEECRRQAAEALVPLERARELVGDTATLHRRRARYLAALGDAERAEQERAKGEALPPRTALDWFLLGYDKWSAEQDVLPALRDFDRALALDPTMFWPHFFQAVAHLQLKNGPEARASLTICIDRKPRFPWPYLLRGLVRLEARDFAGAEADFARAWEELPREDAPARYIYYVNRGYLGLKREQYDRAVGDLTKAVQLRPEAYHAYVNLAQAYAGQKKLGLAVRELDKAIRLEGRLPSLYTTRASFHRRQNHLGPALADSAEAIRLLQRSGPSSPELARAHLQRGQVLYQGGRYQGAVQACQEALKVCSAPPPRPELRQEALRAHRLRGEALLELKQYKEAVAAFDRYLAEAKPDVEALRKHALACWELGDHAGIVEDCGRALAIKPDAEAHVLRGWAYLVSNAPRLALHDFQKAIDLAPGRALLADAYCGRGFARVTLGQARPAVTDASKALREGPPSARLSYNAARIFAQAAGAADFPAATRLRYQEEAVSLIHDALKRTPAEGRATFCRNVILNDPALRPIQRSPALRQLVSGYTKGLR